MRLLTKRRKLEPAWVYQARGMVWRVFPAGEDMFVGEDRDVETKHVSFFCLNRANGKVLWEDVSFDEAWWISIEAVHRDRVFLHGFTRPDMPDHRRIIALDLPTGRVAWSRDDVRYLLAAEDSVFASRDTMSGWIIDELDLRTGLTLRSRENDAAAVQAARSQVQALAQTGPEFPTALSEMPETEEGLDAARKVSRNENIVGPIDVLVKGRLCIFSCHERKGGGGLLKHTLHVVDSRDGEDLFVETLNDDVQSPVPDSFFVQDEMLYFVRDRSRLTAIAIGGSE